MHRVIITLELENEKFDAMENILLSKGNKKEHHNWEQFVIETYYKTETYLDCNDGDLEKAYMDMQYDC